MSQTSGAVGDPRGIGVQVLATPEAAAAAAAAEVARRAQAAVSARGAFTLAVSGGRSPWQMIAALADHDMPWAATTIFQVDERIAPAGDAQRNLVGLESGLPPSCPSRIVPMPVESDDLDSACRAYARALPERVDLVHLGLGADGHTASLIPDDPVLAVAAADVALTGPYQGRRRMTLTYPAIARARAILWLVTGADKREALARLLARDHSIPAGLIDNDDQVLFCDSQAGQASQSGSVWSSTLIHRS